jgi:quinol monooxygenase YgiN
MIDGAMPRFSCRVAAILVLAANLQAQPGPGVVSIGYLDAAPSRSREAAALLKAYRDDARKQDGCEQFELLEQTGRPGRFVLIETWRDQGAFDAHLSAGGTKRFFEAVKPLAIGAYDQRPYKAISRPSGPIPLGSAVYGVMHVDTIPSPQGNAVALLERLAERSRMESGNLRFDVVQQPTRMNHFTVIEAWRDQGAADAHALAAHTKQFRNDLLPILGSPYDDRFYTIVE